MPPATEKQYYLELTRQTLRAARVSANKVEFLRECALDQKPLVEEVLNGLAAGASWRAVAAVTPASAFWHVSNSDEAAKHRGGEAVRQFMGGLPHGLTGTLEFVHCQVEDGAALATKGGTRWVAGATSSEALLDAAAALKERGIESTRLESATLGRVGAVASGLRWAGRGRTLVWELAAERSHLFLITSRGVDAVVTCPVGFETIFGAVQAALGLKFKGAAARLFYNEGYDFADAATKVAAEIAPALKSSISGLTSGGPIELTCTGTLAHQSWLVRETAAAAGMGVWQPDVAAWLKSASLQVDPSIAVSSESLGVLHLASYQGREWHPAWMRAGALDPKPAVAAVAAAAQPVALAEKNGSTTKPPAVAVAEPVLTTAAVTRTDPAPISTNGARGRGPVDLQPPSRSGKAEVRPSGAVVKAGPTGGNGRGGSSVNVAEATSAPAPVVAEKKPRSYGVFIGLGAALVAAVVAGKFYLDAEESKRLAELEKAQAALVAQSAQTRTQEIEQRAKEEAARILREAEAARETAVALARKQAEEQTRLQITAEIEAERIANSPGILIVTTSPSGAQVSIDGGAPQLTPLALNDLKPGLHSVEISMPGYATVTMSADIKGTQTTDLGLIPLDRLTGTVVVSSSPEGAEFTMRKAGDMLAAVERTGRTPARFDDVMPGDYQFTFTRPGWESRSETVTVTKQGTVEAATQFKGGAVAITSIPTGATIRQNGVAIGRTPLTLMELRPQDVRYELSLDGFDPMVVSGAVVSGEQLKLEGRLLSVDRIASAGEIATAPQAVETPALDLAGAYTEDKISVSFIVQRDGTLKEITVSGTTDRALARRCLDAVARWKFKPAVGHDGQPLNVRVAVPIVFNTN